MTLKSFIKSKPILFRLAHKVLYAIDYMQWLAQKPKIKLEQKQSLKIHLGCGDINHPDFVNVDLRPLKHIHYIGGIDNLKMFRKDSVDLIYTSHCLEHVPHAKIDKVIKEWNRILKPGGKVRISVPDFDKITLIYRENNNSIAAIINPLMGGQDYKENFHYSVFNYDSLADILSKNDFIEIKEWKHGSDEYSSFPDWSGGIIEVRGQKYPISLNIEAIKR